MVQLPPRTPEPPDNPTPAQPDAERRRKYRPPAGIPVANDRQIGGKVAAVLIHLLIILLIVIPFTSPELVEQILGAGGPGPAGGGGGGHKGKGGGVVTQERTQFVRVAPPPPPPPTIRPPEIKPPVVPPIVEPPKPAVPDQKAEKSDKAPTEVSATVAGTGGGTGNDGTDGNGPGTGGGKGTGVGTGTGTQTGPGTGGGPGTVYAPSPIEIVLPPMPTPKKLLGKSIVAEFDVDSTGRVLDFKFQETNDGSYNRKLRETFNAVRFRPGVNGLGTPVRAKTQLTIVL